MKKYLFSLILILALVMGLCPALGASTDGGSTCPAVTLGSPTVSGSSYSYSEATVSGTASLVTITVDSGSFALDGYTPLLQDLSGLSKTYQVTNAAAAQSLLQACVFTPAGTTTQNVTISQWRHDKHDCGGCQKCYPHAERI